MAFIFIELHGLPNGVTQPTNPIGSQPWVILLFFFFFFFRFKLGKGSIELMADLSMHFPVLFCYPNILQLIRANTSCNPKWRGPNIPRQHGMFSVSPGRSSLFLESKSCVITRMRVVGLWNANKCEILRVVVNRVNLVSASGSLTVILSTGCTMVTLLEPELHSQLWDSMLAGCL